ncbi:hypothetical protein BJ508DRAFT_364324 [Ascobolus immersus RN42]|uniref:Uncharacterized protein n=1 Tax=Ascobolus immersus RN42 TaxID=1160509 RepID=A0A3N4I0I7_ASCIM|nr:hypothetical protein BJ508DRAFT_364324 [Ascobolus immersus RN42]
MGSRYERLAADGQALQMNGDTNGAITQNSQQYHNGGLTIYAASGSSQSFNFGHPPFFSTTSTVNPPGDLPQPNLQSQEATPISQPTPTSEAADAGTRLASTVVQPSTIRLVDPEVISPVLDSPRRDLEGSQPVSTGDNAISSQAQVQTLELEPQTRVKRAYFCGLIRLSRRRGKDSIDGRM